MGHRRRLLEVLVNREVPPWDFSKTTVCPELDFRLCENKCAFVERVKEARALGPMLNCIPKLKRQTRDESMCRRKGSVDRDLRGIGEKPWTVSTENLKKAFPRLHDLASDCGARSCNLGKAFLGDSVFYPER